MFTGDTYTLLHVAISLVGIASGLIVGFGLVASKRLDVSTGVFLGTTLATSATGFGFPFDHILPSHIVGAISIVVLAVAIVARYSGRMKGGWRATYVIAAMLAFYFNVFVLVVQLFQKVPALKELAPTQSEPPFAITQLAILVILLAWTVLAAKRFRPIA